MRQGSTVRAVVKITEAGFHRPGRVHVHARAGDVGRVCLVRGSLVLVRWARTGTACDCDVSEVERITLTQRVAA